MTPWRVVNFGNSIKVRLEDFIDAIEVASGHRVIGSPMDMQQGDVPATWADASRLGKLTGYRPATEFAEGVARFGDRDRIELDNAMAPIG